MKLLVDDHVADAVVLLLTKTEAAELRDALDDLLQRFDEPGWHAHVSSADYLTEITVAPDGNNGGPNSPAGTGSTP